MLIRQPILGLILVLSVMVPPCAVSSPGEKADTASIERGKEIYPLCASCHLDNGWGKEDGSFPVIAGQHRNVLIKQLDDIRARNRENPTMFPFSDPKTIGGHQAVEDVALYISTMKPDPRPGRGDGSQLKLGKQIYQQRCQQCHGKQAEGSNEAYFPRLKGQHHAYLVRQLKWIRDGYRKNSNPGMLEQVKDLSDSDFDAVADYLSRL